MKEHNDKTEVNEDALLMLAQAAPMLDKIEELIPSASKDISVKLQQDAGVQLDKFMVLRNLQAPVHKHYILHMCQ